MATANQELKDSIVGFIESNSPQTFAAFEGKIEGDTIRGVSLLQVGPALGHGVWVDNVMLEQAKRLASRKGKLKAKQNHFSGIEDNAGYWQNFRIRGEKLLADFSFYKAAKSKDLLMEMVETVPGEFGVSIVFQRDKPDYDKTNDRYCERIREIYSADFVDTPAANRDGVFEAEIDSGEDDMPADPAPATVTLEAFEAYKTENDAKTAKIAALEAEVAALKEPKQPEPVKPEPTALSAELAEVKTLLKAFAAAPPTKQEPAPVNEPEQIEPPMSFSAARKEAIGTATGLARIAAARAFDKDHPSEAAYLASFKK